MNDLLLLGATLHAAGWALVVHRGRLYALHGSRRAWRGVGLCEAATALEPSLWGEA